MVATACADCAADRASSVSPTVRASSSSRAARRTIDGGDTDCADIATDDRVHSDPSERRSPSAFIRLTISEGRNPAPSSSISRSRHSGLKVDGLPIMLSSLCCERARPGLEPGCLPVGRRRRPYRRPTHPRMVVMSSSLSRPASSASIQQSTLSPSAGPTV